MMSSTRNEMATIWCAAACALLALPLLGCDNDGAIDPAPGGTAAGTAVGGSGGSGGSGGAGGTSGVGGTGACDGVEQPSVKIVITNHLAAGRYIDWTTSGSSPGLREILRFEREVGSQWEPVPFVRPNDGCMSPCTEDNAGQDCCMFCDGGYSGTKLLDPGESHERWWSGQRYKTDDAWCDCDCFWACPPEAGHYRVLVDVYEAIQCGSQPCDPPNEQGVTVQSSLAGEPTTYSAEFDVLYDQLELPLAIE